MNVAWPARWLRMYYGEEYAFSRARKQSGVKEGEGITDLDAVDCGPLFIYDDGIDVTAKDDRDGGLVLALSRLAQVDQPATHA